MRSSSLIELIYEVVYRVGRWTQETHKRERESTSSVLFDGWQEHCEANRHHIVLDIELIKLEIVWFLLFTGGDSRVLARGAGLSLR